MLTCTCGVTDMTAARRTPASFRAACRTGRAAENSRGVWPSRMPQVRTISISSLSLAATGRPAIRRPSRSVTRTCRGPLMSMFSTSGSSM